MKKLNNKGLTIIEILLCFVLVVTITVGLFSMLNAYKNKEQLTSDKNEIIKYKYLLTKDIQDDLIKKGLKDANVVIDNPNDHSSIYTITLTFQDDSQKVLKITKLLAAYEHENISSADDQDDFFMIEYGPIDNMIKYKLPNLGDTTNQNGKKVYFFKLNNINVRTDNNILSIYIGFYYPDLLTRYAIDIVCPFNY